jgi:hypothetical protein
LSSLKGVFENPKLFTRGLNCLFGIEISVRLGVSSVSITAISLSGGAGGGRG